MNFNDCVILHSCNISINIFNVLLTSFSSINISKELPDNLECIPLNEWLNMRNQVKIIYIKTNENITKLKIILILFLPIAYYYYYFFLIIILNIYFIFNTQNKSRENLLKIQRIFNNTVFREYNVKIFFKINYLNIYLYVVKPRIEMTEVIQDGVIDIGSIDVDADVENLPRAIATEIVV